jgi:hypothetical protein
MRTRVRACDPEFAERHHSLRGRSHGLGAYALADAADRAHGIAKKNYLGR